MHPLHDHIARQLARMLKERHIVVWYDASAEYAPFIDELREGRERAPICRVTVGERNAALAEYTGSYFELRESVEPLVANDEPEDLIIYIPGMERDPHTVLMELEKGGDRYKEQLRQGARVVLRQRYTDGVVDEILAREGLDYRDLAEAASGSHGAEAPSLLKPIFGAVTSTDEMMIKWLVWNDYDQAIEKKGALPELTKLIRSQLGLDLPTAMSPVTMRATVQRYLLAGEFRSDLRCAPPSSIEAIPFPAESGHATALRNLTRKLRESYPAAYEEIADRIETELGLRSSAIAADMLGSIDTFRFEEHALLGYCGTIIAAERFEEALRLVDEREQSFWLDRDVRRKAQWEACRRMAKLGAIAVAVRGELAEQRSTPAAWIDAYTAKDGWHRLDRAQRQLEAWVATLDDEPEEYPLAVVRRAYEDTCHAMIEGFTKSLVAAQWSAGASLTQTQIFAEMVANRPKPVAYFLVDALRFEMGIDLAERLPKSAEVGVRAATGVLPSITPIGMAALMPGASSSFDLAVENGRFGARIEETFLPDLAARKKFAAARIPDLVDIALDDILGLSASALAKRIEGAQIIMIRSQEIDHAGETGFTRQARRIMDEVIGDIASAIQRLARAGVEHTVVAADHGHLFFAADRDESMRINSPGGNQIELHRRCWIGYGGATPPGCVRVSAASLGYRSDLELVFPMGAGVFKAGGDLAFHHGGPSLQESVIPVVSVRLKPATPSAKSPVAARGVPEAITNRIFSITLELDPSAHSIFATAITVRPVLMHGGRQVGVTGMAIDTTFDSSTGCIKLRPDARAIVAFQLSDDSVPSLRIVVQDPTTDAELYRSPNDIPVRLGV